MKRILITGQHSYLGTSFEKYLTQRQPQWQIKTISVHGDGWKKEDFSKYDVIFHVAGKAHVDVKHASETVKKEYNQINHTLAVEVAQKAKAEGVRQFVYPSSAIIYGDSVLYTQKKSIKGETIPKPSDFYGQSKWMADQHLRKLQSDTFCVDIVRLPMIYGPGCKGNYPLLAKLARWLPVFPKVENERSMLYIANLCEFLYQIIAQQESGIFFPQNAEYVQTSRLVRQVAKMHRHPIWMTKILNPFVAVGGHMPGAIGKLVKKAFGNLTYQEKLSIYRDNSYQWVSFEESIRQTEQNVDLAELGGVCAALQSEVGKKSHTSKKVLLTASVASMIDLFNRHNIQILKEMGLEVEVAANFSFGSITSQEKVNRFRKELQRKGIKVYDVPIPRNVTDFRDIIKSYRQLKKIIEKHSYQMIHTQSPIGGVVTRLAAKKTRKKNLTKVIYTAHGFHFFKGASKKNWFIFYPIERYCAKLTDVLITINEEDYKRAKHFSTEKVCCLPGIGINLQQFSADWWKNDAVAMQNHKEIRTEVRREWGLKTDDFVLLSVGQLSKRKNQEVVMDALTKVENHRIKYVIVGLGEYKERYEQQIRERQLQNRVILAGYRSDIQKILHAADCFIFPSLQEGLPVSLMEAMASAVPVICSEIRGNTDLVRDEIEGLLVKTNTPQAYADAIVKMEENPQLADNCRKHALERIQEFSCEKVDEKMREIYRAYNK